MLAERAGLRIHEVPVDWVDDPDSRVDIVATALADLRGVARLARDVARRRAAARGRSSREPCRASAGRCSGSPRSASSRTLAYALLFLALRSAVGGPGGERARAAR